MAPRRPLNMDILNRSDDEAEEQGRCASSSRLGSRFGKRRAKRRSGSEQHLLLMDCVGSSDNGDGAEEETLPLPDYERLSQSARLPDDPDSKDPPPPLTPVQQQTQAKREAPSPPQPPPTQQQKPAAWRLLEYVRNRHKAGGGGAASGCGVGSDGDSSKSSDGERESEDGGKEGKDNKKKKRSSWLPDPDRRWPVQGFY